MSGSFEPPEQSDEAPTPEPMVDARDASVALRLPHYWFADPLMRDRYRIPHYRLVGLVRYRMSELFAWAQRHASDRVVIQPVDPNQAQGPRT